LGRLLREPVMNAEVAASFFFAIIAAVAVIVKTLP
jgi:hypothetical protein